MAPPAARGFHAVRVERVVRETPDACSVILDITPELAKRFRYAAGQFCTFRAQIDGEQVARCYSMSSSPDVDDAFQVTVKRVPGGAMSNWVNDSVTAGDVLDVSAPSGVFVLGPGGGDVLAFAAGSGITPVFSILKTALATGRRRCRLLYANRDRESVIFGDAVDALGGLCVVHHLDAEDGFVGPDDVTALLAGADDPDCYVCGPGPFMDVVESALLAAGVPAERIHIERFSIADDAVLVEENTMPEATEATVTIEIRGKSGTAAHRPGTTVLQMARQLGLAPPYSCESGNCATCMARLVEGTVEMRTNNALTPDEVEERWVLTCQSVPTSPSVRVVYEDA